MMGKLEKRKKNVVEVSVYRVFYSAKGDGANNFCLFNLLTHKLTVSLSPVGSSSYGGRIDDLLKMNASE
jgi:hypothetical protein